MITTGALLEAARGHRDRCEWPELRAALAELAARSLDEAEAALRLLLDAGTPGARLGARDVLAAADLLAAHERLDEACEGYAIAAALAEDSGEPGVVRRATVGALGCAELLGGELTICRLVLRHASRLIAAGQLDRAQAHVERTVPRLSKLALLNARAEEALASELFGDLAAARGDRAEAARRWNEAMTHFERLQHGRASAVARKLERFRGVP